MITDTSGSRSLILAPSSGRLPPSGQGARSYPTAPSRASLVTMPAAQDINARLARYAATKDARDLWPEVSPSAFRSEEHTSELQSRTLISYAVFCLKKKKKK